MKIAMYGSGAAGSVFASYLRNGGADMKLNNSKFNAILLMMIKMCKIQK